MANEAAKRRIQHNKSLLRRLFVYIFTGNLLVFLKYFLFGATILRKTNVLTFFLEAVTYILLLRISTSTVIRTSKKVEIKYEGADLSGRGFVRILIDTIYISLAAKIVSMLLASGWIILFLVPVTSYYELFLRRSVRSKKKWGQK